MKTNTRLEVVTPDLDNSKIAIGGNGVNKRLASELTGWEIEVMDDDRRLRSVKMKSLACTGTLRPPRYR